MAISVSDVKNALGKIIYTDFLGVDQIVLGTDEQGNPIYTVPVSSFAIMFANAASMSSADLLVVDGGKMGYKEIIQQWKSLGYIS